MQIDTFALEAEHKEDRSKFSIVSPSCDKQHYKEKVNRTKHGQAMAFYPSLCEEGRQRNTFFIILRHSV